MVVLWCLDVFGRSEEEKRVKEIRVFAKLNVCVCLDVHGHGGGY